MYSRLERELLPKVLPYIYTNDGEIFEAFTEADIQAAIDSLPAAGGSVFLPKGQIIINDTITIDKPLYIKGSGMCLPAVTAGTVLQSAAGLAGLPLFEYAEAGVISFGGISDLTIQNQHGSNAIECLSLADAQFRRLFINFSNLNGIYIEGTELNQWNYWVRDCLFENITLTGIRADCADHDINRLHFLDNYMFACDLGINIQQFADVGGTVKDVTIRGNHMLNMGKVGIQVWKDASHVHIDDNILIGCGQDAANTYSAIRVGDGDAAGDLCENIKIRGNSIEGEAQTKWGVSLEDFTNRVIVMGNMIEGCATASYNAEGTCTNIERVHNLE